MFTTPQAMSADCECTLGTDVITKATVLSIFYFYSKNIISLDVYFEDLSYDEIEQIPVFEAWTLVCKLPW